MTPAASGLFVALLSMASMSAMALEGPTLRTEFQDRQQRVDQWYAPARYGMFFHWGLFTGGSGERPIPYDTVAAFEAAAPDPTGIASNMVASVKKAGSRYLIYTVFHSCSRYMVTYPTKVEGYKWKTTKDYFGALVNQCHKEGIRLIVYMGPDSNNAFKEGGPHMTEDMRDQQNVYAAVKEMCAEILDRHGEKIGGFWFDGGYRDDIGELIHARQPNAVVIHHGRYALRSRHVDYGTLSPVYGPLDPEYSRPSGRTHSKSKSLLPPRDFNEDYASAGNWWYKTSDDKALPGLPYVRDRTYLVKQMVSSLGQRRQWNFVLCCGPMMDGRLPPCFEPMLENSGSFLKWAGESIYDTVGGEGSAFDPGWNLGAYCSVTVSRNDPRIHYIHVTTPPPEGTWLEMRGNGYQVQSVADLRTGTPVKFEDNGAFFTIQNKDWKDVADFGDKVFKVTLVGAGGEGRGP